MWLSFPNGYCKSVIWQIDCGGTKHAVCREMAMSATESVSLVAGDLDAVFWPTAGLLGVSFRHRGAELLRRIDDLGGARAKGNTVGIPLLYPWANRLASLRYCAAGRDVVLDPASPLLHFDDHGLSMHGVPWGQLAWEIVEARQDSFLARLDWDRPELLAVFPFPHTVKIKATLNLDSLTLRTEVSADGGSSVPISFGFHPYFGIPQLPRAQWRLELPTMHRLPRDSRGIPTGAQESFGRLESLLGDNDFDDGFALFDEPCSFSLSGAGRRITISFLEGFPYAQVFAPKGKDFIALEPMTAPTDALISGHGLRVLEPGAQFRAAFRISVHSVS
jgi:aldose 1-epimerase